MGSEHLKNFLDYIRKVRNKILLGMLGAVGVAALALLGGIIQEWYKADKTTAAVVLRSSSFAAFPSQNSIEVMQLSTYEASASDLLKYIKITAIFGKDTEIAQHNVLYTVDIEGSDYEKPQKNYLILRLKHDLDVKRRALIYILTKKIVVSREYIKSEVPEVRIQGIDKNGKIVNY